MWRALAVCAALLLLFAIATPMGRYLARAGWAEAGILARRRPIAAMLADSGTDARTRGKLALVERARDFARDSLHLEPRESFTTYSAVRRDTLVLVVSAAYRDTLAFKTWWFPIVGRVPYKGFFDFAQARALAQELERDSLDAYVRPAEAFSTLGFFNDPLLSTTLLEDSASLANTVIHELTHNRFFAPGQAVFNESFANFVGGRGSILFFEARGDTAQAAAARLDWEREKFLGRFWSSVFTSLDSAFRAHPGDRAARLRARDTVFARTRAWFARDILPNVPGLKPGQQLVLRLDNGTILARRLYRTGLDDFDALYARESGDLRKSVERIIALARARPDSPFVALRAYAASGAEPAAQQRP
jgi:predicted aminopeptidase